MDYEVIYFLMDYGVNYHPSLRACLGKNMQIWKKGYGTKSHEWTECYHSFKVYLF